VQQQLRMLARMSGAALAIDQRLRNDPTKGKLDRLVAASQQAGSLTTFAATKTFIAGGIGLMFRAFISGGPDEAKALWADAINNPFEFARDAAAYALLSGPAEFVMRAAEEGDPLAFLSTSQFVAIAKDAMNASFGWGEYKNEPDPIYRMFVKRPLAISRPLNTWLFGHLMGENRPAADAMSRSVWRWKKRNDLLYKGGASTKNEEEDIIFRKNMRRAFDAIKAGKIDSGLKHMARLLTLDGADGSRAAASLRVRSPFRIGNGWNILDVDTRDAETARKKVELLKSMRETIGDSAYAEAVRMHQILYTMADELEKVRDVPPHQKLNASQFKAAENGMWRRLTTMF